MPVPIIDMRPQLIRLADGLDFESRWVTPECAIILHYWGVPPHCGGIHHAVLTTFGYHRYVQGWRNIGYHYLVSWPHGEVAYVGDVFTTRANVWGRNDLAIGICVEGDLVGEIPEAVIEGVRCAVADVRAEVARRLGNDGQFAYGLPLFGHQEFALPGHGTLCPGAGGMQLVDKLRG